MNSLERVTAAVNFAQCDRTPVIAQVFAHAATLGGVPVDQYVREGATLARCQIDAWRRYGYDAVFSVMDVNVETEAVGSMLRYRRDQYPVVDRFVLSGGEDGRGLSVPDPHKSGRMPEMLKALGMMREEIGNEVLVVGCVMGPFTLAAQLLGLGPTLEMAIDEPARLERLMDFATEVVMRFGVAQVRSGAHLPVVFDPCASPAVVPPAFFREFELPRLRRLFDALRAAGATANWLHIAGPVGSILRYYPEAGVQIANFDYCVGAAEARRQAPGICLDGNIRSMAFVEGSPAEIEKDAADLAAALPDGCGRGFILSSGCEIPPESAPENVAALVRAAEAMK